MISVRFATVLSLLSVLHAAACSSLDAGQASTGSGTTPSSGGSEPAGKGGQSEGSSQGGTEEEGGTSATDTRETGGNRAATGGASESGTTQNAAGGATSRVSTSPPRGGKGGTSTSSVVAAGTAAGGAGTGGRTVSAGGKTSAVGGSGATGGSGNGGNNGICVESNCGSHKWPCWKMPNPASENLPNPQSYTELGNGAVRDNVTCLVWEKANPDTAGDLEANRKRCADLAEKSYAGFTDWRLPTRVEMASITDVTRGSTGYPAAFTVTKGYYATGSLWYKTILTDKDTTSGNEVNRVWGYGTNGFTSNAIVRSDVILVARCVRGNGSGETLDEYATEPDDHYTVTGTGADAIVKDNYTGLTWQQTYSSARMAWSAAASYCATQTTGGLSDWRLATLNELASTVNEALVAPAINRTVFPNTDGGCKPNAWFWAAEASKVGGTAWALSYCDGFTGANTGAAEWNTFSDGWVRCVHD